VLNKFLYCLTNTIYFHDDVVKGMINPMEQHTFKNVNNCLNTNIYSYLETSGGQGGQSPNPYLNVVYF